MEKKSLLRCAKDYIQLKIREMYDLRADDLHHTELADHYLSMSSLCICIERMDSIGEIMTYIELGGLSNVIAGDWEEDIAFVYYHFSKDYLKLNNDLLLS
jgi:hypothetical protein